MSIDPGITMERLQEQFPGARRALFRKYHIGGCASCGFQPAESLAEVCARNGGLPVEEVAACILEAHSQDEKVLIDPAEAARLRESSGGRFIDIRTREEFEAVRIPGSELMSQDLLAGMGAWNPGELLVVVDHTGDRSLDAAAYFSGHGLQQVRALRGGIDAWSRLVDPSLPRYTVE